MHIIGLFVGRRVPRHADLETDTDRTLQPLENPPAFRRKQDLGFWQEEGSGRGGGGLSHSQKAINRVPILFMD